MSAHAAGALKWRIQGTRSVAMKSVTGRGSTMPQVQDFKCNCMAHVAYFTTRDKTNRQTDAMENDCTCLHSAMFNKNSAVVGYCVLKLQNFLNIFNPDSHK